jgi:heat shock protein HslJ
MRSTRLGNLVTLMLLGCSNVPSAAEAPTLESTSWVLVSLAGLASIESQPATVRFEAGTVQGSDGCNRYSAPYSVRGASIEVGARGVSTQMACAPEVMKRASAFTAALSASRS